MKNGEFNGFGRQFGAILDNLLSNEGFALPICSLIVGRNGAITAGRYSASDDDHLTYKPIAEYVPEKDAGFRQPVNCLLIDGASGRSARYLCHATPRRAEPHPESGFWATMRMEPAAFTVLDPKLIEQLRPTSFAESALLFREVLLSLVYDHGYGWPIYSITVDSNGSIMAIDYRMDKDNVDAIPHTLTQCIVGKSLKLPINWFFVDSNEGAHAAAIRLEQPQFQYRQ